MKYSEAKPGRIFVIRLEDGDIVHEAIESFAKEHAIKAATLLILGGADKGSRLVVGPDDEGNPVLHMHMACGRDDDTVTGCVRTGVKVWHIMEAVLFELVDNTGVRRFDKITGFKLLQP
jgi:predicted DNA-binding protein with PD1-like motif